MIKGGNEDEYKKMYISITTYIQNFPTNVSNPQNASGIQISQSVTAIFNTNKGQRKAYILFYRGISVITPLRFAGGDGEGVSILYACSLCSVSSVRDGP